MAEIISHFMRGISCDGRGCGNEISGEWVSVFDKGYQNQALAAGWTFWNSRSRRAYCSPACGPRPGHQMRPAGGQ